MYIYNDMYVALGFVIYVIVPTVVYTTARFSLLSPHDVAESGQYRNVPILVCGNFPRCDVTESRPMSRLGKLQCRGNDVGAGGARTHWVNSLM